MADAPTFTLPKRERIYSRKTIERLFGGKSKSVSTFPLRAVYTTSEDDCSDVLVSVSKRYFKRAVKRNRIKRQIREAYRLNKHILDACNTSLHIAFLWRDNKELASESVTEKVRTLLFRITESLPQEGQSEHDEKDF